MTLSLKWPRRTASAEARFAAMAEDVRKLRVEQSEPRVSDPEAVRAEVEAWGDSRREVNGRIL